MVFIHLHLNGKDHNVLEKSRTGSSPCALKKWRGSFSHWIDGCIDYILFVEDASAFLLINVRLHYIASWVDK
jgi:hypothetical protein